MYIEEFVCKMMSYSFGSITKMYRHALFLFYY